MYRRWVPARGGHGVLALDPWAGRGDRPAHGTERTSICWARSRAERRQIRRLVLRPVTVAAIMTRIAATMMLMIHRIQSIPFVASTPSAAAT